MKLNTGARKMGIIAAANNKPYDANPFNETTEEAWQWLSGWLAYKASCGAIV